MTQPADAVTKAITEDLHQRYSALEQRNAILEQQNAALQQYVAELTAKLHWFEEQFRLARHRQFGASSECTPAEQQPLIFNEAEVEAASPAPPEPTLETVNSYRRRKARGHREAMLKDLPVETIEYCLPEADQICPACGGPLHEMSTEVRQELQIIPAQAKVIEHVRHIDGCRHCEREEVTASIVPAPMPAPVIPGSLASASTVAYVMTQKFVEGLPLYRQEQQQFERLGIALSRQTLANWMLIAADRWLSPLYKRMHEHLLRQEILHADETTVQVLHEPGRAAQTQSVSADSCGGARPRIPFGLFGLPACGWLFRLRRAAQRYPGGVLGACTAQVRRSSQSASSICPRRQTSGGARRVGIL